MATQLGETLTTRGAFRQAIVDDILTRAELKATAMEGGPLDGIQVVSMGTLRDVAIEHLQVELPPPSEKYAEVSTPAVISTSTICPECRQPTEIVVKLGAQLTVEGNSTELAVKMKAKSAPHMHGQQPLTAAAGQETIDGAIDKIDDLRLRILSAVYEVQVDHDHVADSPAPTLDAIAQRLELVSESDRGDLEESLYAYSQLEEALVEVVTAKDLPVEYHLTDAGTEFVDNAEVRGSDGIDEAETDEPGDDEAPA